MPASRVSINVIRERGMAVAAEATDDTGARVASAKVTDWLPGRVIVEEQHYSPRGDVIYLGKLVFENGEFLVSDEAITGKKEQQVFRNWFH